MAKCHMIIGALIPHRCPNKARGVCIKCGRPFCDEHLSFTEAGLLCHACEQGFERPVSSTDTRSALDEYDESDFEVFYEDEDPFVDLS